MKIDKDAIKQKVLEKFLNACKNHYEAEWALCEPCAPISWKDDAKRHGKTLYGDTKIIS